MLDPFRDRLDGEPDPARRPPAGPPAPSLRDELLGTLAPARPAADGAEPGVAAAARAERP